MKWLLLFVALAAQGADYLVITDTNAILPPNFAIWRSLYEPEQIVSVTSNWIDNATFTTNGGKQIHQSLVLVTNIDVRFSYGGKRWVEHFEHTLGPTVQQRVLEIPSPVTPPLPMRYFVTNTPWGDVYDQDVGLPKPTKYILETTNGTIRLRKPP